jgi:hypothetical protein
MTSPNPSPFPKSKYCTVYTENMWLWGDVEVLSCVIDHIRQEFTNLTRFRTYKFATPPQTKTPVKTTFGVWCLYIVPSSIVYTVQLPVLNVEIPEVYRTETGDVGEEGGQTNVFHDSNEEGWKNLQP